MSNKEWLYVIKMPINIDGKGPEMNKDKVCYIRWEIWDQCLECYGYFDDKTLAEKACKMMLKAIEKS